MEKLEKKKVRELKKSQKQALQAMRDEQNKQVESSKVREILTRKNIHVYNTLFILGTI